MIFTNRFDAGRRLIPLLKPFLSDETSVLMIPRGGVEIGIPIIKEFKCSWDFIIPRKIGAPTHPEVAIGAVTVDGQYLLNDDLVAHLNISEAYIDEEVKVQQLEIKRRLKDYRRDEGFFNVTNKTIILVDDGIATGFTTLAAIKSIQSHQPKKVILAVPVGPTETIEEFRAFVDEVICLHSIDHFQAVGAYYSEFKQVTELEMKYYIEELQFI